MISKIFKNGFENFKRQPSLAFANTFVIFLALVLGVSLYLFQGVINFAIEEIEDQVDVSVFFKAEVPNEDIEAFKIELEGLEQVKKVNFISKEQAYESFIKTNEEDIYIEALEIIEINPFLSSVRITTDEPAQYREVAQFIGEKEDFEDLIYKIDDFRREEAIQKIETLSQNVTMIGYVLMMFLGLLAVLVTFNTVRLSIFSQKAEIEIMKLVGASNWFIRGPFMVQASLCGFFAGVLSFLSFYIILMASQDSLINLLMGFNAYEYFMSNLLVLLAFQILGGIILGFISSFLAIFKYLRE